VHARVIRKEEPPGIAPAGHGSARHHKREWQDTLWHQAYPESLRNYQKVATSNEKAEVSFGFGGVTKI